MKELTDEELIAALREHWCGYYRMLTEADERGLIVKAEADYETSESGVRLYWPRLRAYREIEL